MLGDRILKYMMRQFGGVVGLLLVAWLSPAAAAELQSIEYQSLGGSRGNVVITFDEIAPEANTFSVDQPARISLDFAGVSVGADARSQKINQGSVRQVIAASAGGRARVVVALTSSGPWYVENRGRQVLLHINQAQAGLTQSAASPQPPRSTTPTNRLAQLQDVEFKRSPNGAAQVLMKFDRDSVQPDIKQQGTKVLIDIAPLQVPSRLLQKYDVTDFGTAITDFDVLKRKTGMRLQVNTVGDYEHVAWQSGRQWVLELRKLTPKEKKEKFPYSGERVNLNFQDIEVRSLLEILADVASLNIVVSDTVTGSITLRLTEVPWDQALDIILETKGYDKRTVGNIIYVAPFDELAAREQKEREAALKQQDLAPLRSEIIQVNYAKAEELSILLRGAEKASLLSGRGTVTVDERTNTLLVNDTPEKLEEIRALVERLDVPVQQVLIESRIVIASDNFTNELGVRFGATTIQEAGDGAVAFGGSASAADFLIDGFRQNGLPTAPPSLGDRLNVSLPVASPAGRFGLAILQPDYLLDLELSALQAEGQGEVVSNPRINTANQQEATIEQGVEVPFQTASDGGTNVQFKRATLRLAVLPQITPDDRIIMDLQVNQDAIGQTVPSGVEGGFIPSIDTRRVQTQVLVDDGETVVLGGIYETTRTNASSKVPVLGDIPILGALFRSKRRTNDKVELLIFVTPRILHEGLEAGR
ncbi:MAG: type IV pilus secretin PilQ family protein [Gammaproteobacteria bacterium]|nr:type IV pilus secretin PilQ family protein [Gammaproteobacteria bacterium]